MSAGDITASFLSCQAGVRELLVDGVDIVEVERTIDAYPLERDHKDALWLWAVGGRERPGSDTSDHPLTAGAQRTTPRTDRHRARLEGVAGHD